MVTKDFILLCRGCNKKNTIRNIDNIKGKASYHCLQCKKEYIILLFRASQFMLIYHYNDISESVVIATRHIVVW